MYPSSDEKIADDLPTWHVGGRTRTRYYHVATHLVHYLILPGILKIQITETSFWVQCPTFITPAFGGVMNPQITVNLGFSLTTNMWYLYLQ